jgi:diaminopimelate epimerase
MIAASKYHSYGNDYLVIRESDLTRRRADALTRDICRRHFGIGGDGCVFVEPGGKNRFRIRIFNPDGSEAAMSGNGCRCAGALVHHRGWSRNPNLTLETLSGVKIHQLLDRGESSWRYRSSLGRPSFIPEEIPVLLEGEFSQVVHHSLQVGTTPVTVTALSVGNPQCVVFFSTLPQDAEFRRLGSALEVHPAFPERTNVSFVQVTGPRRLQVRIWERGVGPTHSSGTGCSGAAVAAIHTGRVGSPARIGTETGEQEVEWQPGGEVHLTGRVEFVGDVHYHWREHDGK